MSFADTLGSISNFLYSATPQPVVANGITIPALDINSFLQPLQADTPLAYNQQSKDTREAFEYAAATNLASAGVIDANNIITPVSSSSGNLVLPLAACALLFYAILK